MSDTSGDVDFGAVNTEIKDRLRRYAYRGSPIPKPRGKKKDSSKKGEQPPVEGVQSASAVISDSVAIRKMGLAKELVWLPLHNNALFEKAWINSELLAYLKRMAELIEIAGTYGLAAVMKEFEVRSDSAFSALQRNIRKRIGGATEFSGAAAGSFQTGSTKWAARLLGKSDPTKFRVDSVVEAVSGRIEYALVLSPTLILEEYGERLLRSALPGGEKNKQVVEDAIDSYYKQLKAFMKEHNNSDDWGSTTITNTVKKFAALMLI